VHRLEPSVLFARPVARWDRELTDDEQQCLVFTRILLHKPRWVVVDEVLDTLEDDARKRVISLFNDGLKDAAIINIGRPEAKNHFFKRVLHLIKDPHGPCFIPNLSVAFAGQPMAAPAVRPVGKELPHYGILLNHGRIAFSLFKDSRRYINTLHLNWSEARLR
jgi:hypothetical protein